MKKKATVVVEVVVEVEFDEDRLNDPEFVDEFSSSIAEGWDSVNHVEHLGWLGATGRADLGSPDEFVEGYGPIGEMGISGRIASSEVTSVGIEE